MSAILVTGGAGYIGSQTCKALAKEGYTPIVYDNLVYGHEWAVRWGPFERGDIADRARLDEVIQSYQPSAIMHFAAYAYVGESVEDPGKYYRNNVAGSLSLLEVCRDHGIGRFIFSSTCATYGVPVRVPITEDEVQLPINPYGASKLMIERMLADFDKAHDLRSISLRYFNAAGADPEGELGEDHDPETHLIPLVLSSTLDTENTVTVFGNDYPTPDGTCVRDYIHVADLATAHVQAVKKLEGGCATTAVNLGTGRGYSVNEVVTAVERVTGRKVNVRAGDRRQGDPPILVAEASRGQKVLDWQPEYSELDVIIDHAWRWLTRENPAVNT